MRRGYVGTIFVYLDGMGRHYQSPLFYRSHAPHFSNMTLLYKVSIYIKGDA